MPRALWKTWAWPRILWIEAGQWRWYWREKLHLDKFGHWEWEHEFKTCPTGDRHCNHYHWKWGKCNR